MNLHNSVSFFFHSVLIFFHDFQNFLERMYLYRKIIEKIANFRIIDEVALHRKKCEQLFENKEPEIKFSIGGCIT